ncbi:winged helix-turn-helix domain-containing protein [Atlantibacter subterranea]|uniref:winged helix-turn-helix domain-containing protein n=1 Tax=Atlantibacter subterraneus TaxID=255519 RepID=UPI0020C2C9A4|nr:winged helix-turn-helix domain-containing protein [Atlantibacter subterranea]UTJ45925.1 winged helix-turn-helix domain-containing protein [Atlantibacter subterranea]
MAEPVLSLQTARNLHLAAQGLLRKPRRRARAEDILAAITQMSLLQIDTINVVARSPYLVLFSRLGSYPMHWLDDALARGELMEYWAHEACFLPRSDFELVRHQMLQPENMGWKYRAEWMAEHAADITELLDWIGQNGPVRSADFAHPRPGQRGWWDWKPHKRHLEGLFSAGKVMVIERRNFQRVYDLTTRVMPHWDDDKHLLPQERAQARMLENSARSLGIFKSAWLADYYRLKKVSLTEHTARWQAEGRVVSVEVESLGQMWLHQDLLPLLECGKSLRATHSAVLSPFDPVVWDRRRAEQLFNFTYRLECYTPAQKRQYGYFTLPLLHCGQLVGRMDAKMHRKTGELAIIALYLEADVAVTASLVTGLQQAITDFALWQDATRVTFASQPLSLQAAWGSGWEIQQP